MLHRAIIIFRRPDRYASLTACALSLTLSHGRGNSVAVVFAVTRFLPLRVFTVAVFGAAFVFPPIFYCFSHLTPSPVGEGWGEGGKPQVCFIVHSAIISDGLTVMQALRLVPLSLTLSHGRGNSVTVVFAVARFLPLRVFTVACFYRCVFLPLRCSRRRLFFRQSYRFSNLAPSPVGEGWGEGGKPQVCFIAYSVIIIFRRPDHYSSLTACALALTLSHGRGNSVTVVFAVTRFLPSCVFAIVHFSWRLFFRQSYRFSNLAPSPVGEGWGEGGKPQVCFIAYSVIIIFRRPDRYASLTACALSLPLSHGRGNSVAVVFAVTRFLPSCVFAIVHFSWRLFFRQSYRFSHLTPSPVGEGWGEGGKPQVCIIPPSAIIIFRRPDHYSSLAACALSLTLSHGRGNSVTVVFAVTRFFTVVCFCRCAFWPALFSRQPYRFSNLAPSPAGEGWGEGGKPQVCFIAYSVIIIFRRPVSASTSAASPTSRCIPGNLYCAKRPYPFTKIT
ncbi:hypothetical protein LVJ83_10420 [Uruburuella testudinis]|uniref:Uncharacterized protein n=1 Tax=Uruburuella testudinis TaxID=1282863 RepID=A0ABY4DQQ9_9NEIS|nr:hypothetical protein [Uruburuella testudinis]UOO81370.1 hypothetical protein LVJ83_10420 [Uruburuella testudinis]